MNIPCSVMQGSQPFSFKWFRDKSELSSNTNHHHNHRYHIETKASMSVLSIPKIEPKDAGNYSCLVSNDFGFDTQWTIIYVKGLVRFFPPSFPLVSVSLVNYHS